MQKIILSANSKEYTLVTNGIDENVSTGEAYFTFYPVDGETLEQIETYFTGNELIKMVDSDDEEQISLRNVVGYVEVKSVSKINDYIVGGVNEEGEDIKETVIRVICRKPSVEAQISSLSEAVDDIITSIL